MQKKIYTVDDLRSIIAPIAARHGVDRIYLFGSYARGDANQDSDIDLRVDKGLLKGFLRWEPCTAIWKMDWEKS